MDARFAAIDARLEIFEARMDARFAEMDARIGKCKAELVRWVFLVMLGNVALSAGATAVLNSAAHALTAEPEIRNSAIACPRN